jgi:hypothetical protein
VTEINKVNERERSAVDDEHNSSPIQRITHSPSTEGILDNDQDIVIPVRLPRGFAEYSNNLVNQSLADAGVSGVDRKPTLTPREPAEEQVDPHNLVLYLWRIDNVAMWQQLDRRIDE